MNKIVKKIGIAAVISTMLVGMVSFAACHKHELSKVDAVSAGCETAGNTEYYTCDCGKWYGDENAETEITDRDSVVINPVGHEWDSGVIGDDGITKTLSCLNCTATKTETVSVSYTITYNLNYAGAPAAQVVRYEGNKPATAPETPVRTGSEYTFGGWYTDEICETKYDFTQNLTGDTVVYARWKIDTLYVFEAEYVNVKELEGKGWSNEASGITMIGRDTNGSIGKPGISGASNGFYLGYLYKNGVAPTFDIVSDRDVENATLTMRLSGEILDTISLTSEEFLVEVNGVRYDYPTIVITDIDTDLDAPKREFQDFMVTTSLKLKEGLNTIKLIVNNGKKMGGTIYSTAPLIDCIKISTDASLKWKVDRSSNLDKFKEQ